MNLQKMVPGGTFAAVALVCALIAGGTYLFGMDADIPDSTMLIWKGLGVWLLAVYAGLCARSNDGWIIALVMAMGALGDVLVERNLAVGSAAFIVGHIAATYLYLSNRRPVLTQSQRWLAIVTVPAVMLISWSLTADAGVTFYSLFLSVMAASAWISRFPRYQTGIGAMLVVVSDLLIFAQMGPMADADWISTAIWALYFAGQVMIVLGVTRTLAKA
jgi:uncharacterized membrane protein YhhN